LSVWQTVQYRCTSAFCSVGGIAAASSPAVSIAIIGGILISDREGR